LSITVTTLVDQNNGVNVGGISLREAIAAAAPLDTINFAPSLFNGNPATMQLLLGSLVIDKALTITGPGQDLLTIDANQNFLTADDVGGVFRINSGVSSGVFDVGISGLSAGVNLVLTLPDETEHEVLRRAGEAGITVQGLAIMRHPLAGREVPDPDGIIVGFAAPADHGFATAVDALLQVLTASGLAR